MDDLIPVVNIYLFCSYKPNNGVDFRSNYYLLNPSGDLKDTQLAF